MADLILVELAQQPAVDERGQVRVEGLAVTDVMDGLEQGADVKGRGVDLGDAAVDARQLVDGLHGGAARVLGGEDAVAPRLGKLADEGEVGGALGHDVRAVAGVARHEERRHVRHHDGHGLGPRGGELGDLGLGDAHVVQPLLRDFLAGALGHGLLDVVARHVDEQPVDPDHDLVGRLLLEVRLAVHRPAHEPLRVAHADDAARHDLAAEGVALADLLDISRDPLVERRHRRRLPFRVGNVGAKDVGSSKDAVLGRDAAPQIPRRSGTLEEFGGRLMVPVVRVFRQ